MLDISKISHSAVYENAWRQERSGKLTGSKNGLLISEASDKGKFTANGMTYIQGIAGEILTGLPANEEFFTDGTDHGNAHEPEAIVYFSEQLGKSVLRNEEKGDTHRLIIHDEYSCTTPDALICAYQDEKKLWDETGTKIKVAPMEVKAPLKHHRFLKLYQCNTPADIKKREPLYYWQVINQMIMCDSMIGYFGVYNPYFPIKGKLFTFDQRELKDDVKKMNQTLYYAKEEIKKIVALFGNVE